MKKLLALSLLIVLPLLLAMGGSPKTEEAAEVAPSLILGVVDTNKVFNESTIAQEGFKFIQEAQQKAETELMALESIINESEATEEEKNARKQVELQAAAFSLQEKLEVYQAEVVKIIEKALEDALTKVRNENKMQQLLARDVVLSFGSESDVTSQVLTEINLIKVTFPQIPDMTLNTPAENTPQPE